MPIPVLVLLLIIGFLLGTLLLYLLIYVVSALFVNPNKIYMKHSKYYRTILNMFTMWAVYIMRIRVHLEGFDKIPQDTRFLLVQNHRSKFDPIVTWFCMMKYDVAFISKEENMHIPIFGRIIRRCCFMSIDREHPSKAMETVKNAAELIKDNQVSIGIYPEGTRNTGEGLLPFHNSVFKIAQMANVPIVVVGIKNADQVAKNFPKHSTDIYLEVTGVMTAEEIKGVKTHVIGDEVRKQLESFLES